LGLPVKSHAAELINLFKGCTTETEAAAALEGYSGEASDSELQGALELWRWGNPEILQERTVGINFGFMGNYEQLSDGRLILFDATETNICLIGTDGSVERRFKKPDAHNLLIVGMSPDEKFLYTGSDRGDTVQKWDITSGKMVMSFAPTEGSVLMKAVLTRLLPGGKSVFTCNSINRPQLWDTETGKEICSFPTVRSMGGLAFSGDGSTGFFGTKGQIIVVDMKTQKEINTLKMEYANLQSISPSYDGKVFAIQTYEGEPGKTITARRLSLYHTATGVLLGELEHKNAIEKIYWLASGNHLLVCTSMSVLLVDVEKVELLSEHSIPAGNGSKCTFSQDGKTLGRHTGIHKTGSVRESSFFIIGRKP
ncbi:MAG: hypothetical protein KDB82_11260, partial [Planctomycetes bacterium]|nr:hypothetical protein [Planctomycetota bacterium]